MEAWCHRVDPPDSDKIAREIGGNYWKGTYWAGQSGDCLLVVVNETATSPVFKLDTHVSFLIGGKQGRVELEDLDLPGIIWSHTETDDLGMVRRDYPTPPARLHHRARLVVYGEAGRGILLDDVVSSDSALPVGQGAPLWGFADLHAHLFNHLTFGGRLISGRFNQSPLPADKVVARELAYPLAPSMANALQDCGYEHGRALGQGVFSVTPELGHLRSGFPTFDGWPTSSTLIHQQAYVEWLRRAWSGGLRLIQVDVGNSAFSAASFAAINQWLSKKKNPFETDADDDTLAIGRTLAAAWQFVTHEGSGFAKIALTPAQAREIIRDGQLAIVLGVEVDAIPDLSGPASTSPIDETIDKLYRAGVRHIIPVHLIENPYGYPSVYNRTFDINSQWANGQRSIPLMDGSSRGARFRVDDDDLDGNRQLTWTLSQLENVNSTWDPLRECGSGKCPFKGGHIAALGLKTDGRLFISSMMKRGMIVDLEHMGDNTTNDALAMAEANHDYPVMLSHTGFRELSYGFVTDAPWDPKNMERSATLYDTSSVEKIANDRARSRDQFDRVRALGGMVGVGLASGGALASPWGRFALDCDASSKSWMHAYAYAVDVQGGRGIALGTDVNGFGGFPVPRFGTAACSGAHGDDYRELLLGPMADRQRNGVRYDSAIGNGIVDAGIARFSHAGDGWAYSADQVEVWQALALASATEAKGGDVAAVFARIDAYDLRGSGQDPHAFDRVRRYAKGFAARSGKRPDLLEGVHLRSRRCLVGCSPDALEQEAYDCFPDDIEPRKVPSECKNGSVDRVVQAWLAMRGSNDPAIKKYCVRETPSGPCIRDFDVNVEGVAHYGLIPDFLQDVKNLGMSEQELAPLFLGAEDYVEAWERAISLASEPTPSDRTAAATAAYALKGAVVDPP